MAVDGLSAGAVARRLGVAVTTLRTWHQRYGLGPSSHVAGHHRRYTAADLARLETMQRLTARGVPPADAARWARRAPSGPGDAAEPPGGARAGTERAGAPSEGAQPAGAGPTGRHGGGNVIPTGRAGVTARGLARAAIRLDSPAMRDLIEHSIRAHGVIVTWDSVLRPVLVGVGRRHAATTELVEVEHLLSRTVSEVLGAVPRPGGHPPEILLACADEEQHSLPLEALAAALAEAGVACRLLGARVPPEALRDAIARTGPVAVVVWAQLPANANPVQLSGLLAGHDRPLLLAAAGPGWRPDAVPDGVAVLGSLAEAVSVTVAAVGPPDGQS